jgi:uncharacterized protein (DUF885 family)
MSLYDKYFDEYIKLHPSLNDIFRISRYKHLQVHYENYLSRSNIQINKDLCTRYLKILNKDRLNIYDRCLKYNLELDLKGFKYNLHLMPITQLDNQISNYIQILSGTGYFIFETIEDYKDFMLKNKEFSIWCDQLIINLDMGITQQLVIPKILCEKLINELEESITNQSYYNKNVPNNLRSEWDKNVNIYVVVPINKVLEFIKSIYLIECRDTLGYSSLPNGKNIYKYLVKLNITMNMSIKKIHMMGIKEINKIVKQMNHIVKKLNYKDGVKNFMNHLQSIESNKYKSIEEILTHYENTREYLSNDLLPRYFDLRIKKNYKIVAVPKDLENNSSGAYYLNGDLSGKRDGVFYLNMRNYTQMLRSECLSLSKHEGIPGHHFHITYMNENAQIPLFIKTSNYNAFIEGYALYTENLGTYDDISYFGKLNSEMLRAIRLVVDTGIHYYNWDYQKCYDLFEKYTMFTKIDIDAEIYRYVAIPGQALSYKIGELVILKLRKKFCKKYNNIKKFHKLLLENGQLPLEILIEKFNKII